MLISAFDYRWYVGAIAVTGIVLAAIYMLWAYQRMMTGPNPDDLQVDVDAGGDGVADLGRREIGVLAPLMLALVLFGFYPMPLLDVSNPFAEQLLEHTGVTDDGPTVPVEATARRATTDGLRQAHHRVRRSCGRCSSSSASPASACSSRRSCRASGAT